MTNFDLDEIKSIIALCKDSSIKRFKYDTFEVEFADRVKTEFVLDKEIQGLEKDKMPTEEQFLYASSGFEPEQQPEIKE